MFFELCILVSIDNYYGCLHADTAELQQIYEISLLTTSPAQLAKSVGRMRTLIGLVNHSSLFIIIIDGDVGGDGRELGEPVASEDSRFETAAGA